MNVKKLQKHIDPTKGILSLLVLFFLISTAILVTGDSSEIEELKTQISDLEKREQEVTLALDEAEEKVEILQENIEEYEEDNEELEEDLEKVEKKYEDIKDSIGDALGTVEVLTKVSQVDPQLLQKYSKVYFLNEHYVPETLEDVPDEYLVGSNVTVHGKIYPFLEDLLEDAEEDGMDVRVVSGYRSYDRQTNLKNYYVVTYGAGTANQFSADQGYSEHQLGTAVDFSNGDLMTNFDDFDQVEEYEWMQENAYKYGFTLSYPEGNDYYQFEPWHWRFVGKDLAKYLHKKDLYFYDVDQRKIDEYTADFFDK